MYNGSVCLDTHTSYLSSWQVSIFIAVIKCLLSKALRLGSQSEDTTGSQHQFNKLSDKELRTGLL
jgi:hypothetical protein